jgi:hypothetical protein
MEHLLKSQILGVIATPTMVNQTQSRELSREGLPAGTALKPIQLQDSIAGVPQPSRHFSHLERRVTWIEVAIEHVCNFFSRAWLPDLV